ncbi:LytR/AlgR family response regulator transcription factor [Pinibacter soli]|uniref:LytTR family DNA-binding domain-containing protein n=1 Tax=Pinibacter soli TaxID=3044211 RepID=A0ABT6RHA2_9BACT|nr:LytTR family DNA-binding domain-containing protein [Pinibacter soli]MDI3321952.1 LytTR family DNA-binding domain-containing protein [Pinibacter soli]
MSDPNVIKCLVIDDEPPARSILKNYIEAMPALKWVGECGNAIQALSYLQQHEVQLIFLDIRMPQLSGIDFLKTLKNPPAVIFTTAYSDYAIQSYDLDAVDYLLKPIQFERFIKAINKVLYAKGSNQLTETTVSNEAPAVKESFVYFRADRKMVKVMLRDIHYIESMKDYVKVFTGNGTIVTRQSIISLEAMLPGNMFLRTHRSFIVSLEKIRSFTNEVIEVEKSEIPVGKLYRNNVMRALDVRN